MFSDKDEQLIKELQLENLSDDQKAEVLVRFYKTLNLKIGMALEDRLNEQQLTEFETISEQANDGATDAWLKNAIPDYENIVDEQTRVLVSDIHSSAKMYQNVINKED